MLSKLRVTCKSRLTTATPDNCCECQLSAATAVKISEPKIIRRSLIIKLEGSLLKLRAEERLLGEDDAEDGIVVSSSWRRRAFDVRDVGDFKFCGEHRQTVGALRFNRLL